MSKRTNQDVKRQLFKGLANRKSSNLDSATSNLLSRTLRKNTDKYVAKSSEEREFIIHKSTSPEDYKIFSSKHPIRETKLQALEQSEQAFNEVFHAGFDDSGSEDDEPDVSAIGSPAAVHEDDILISVPGYSKEELTASKRLNINDRRNVRLSKVNPLERAFSSTDFLAGMSSEKIQEYDLMNQEFIEDLAILKEEKDRAKEPHPFIQEGTEGLQAYHIEALRDAVGKLDETSWMYPKRPNHR